MTGDKWAGRRAAELTQRVLEKFGSRCQLSLPGCTGEATTADHIIPKSRGGGFWDFGNLTAACRHCNSSKGAGLNEGPPVELPEWLT